MVDLGSLSDSARPAHGIDGTLDRPTWGSWSMSPLRSRRPDFSSRPLDSDFLPAWSTPPCSSRWHCSSALSRTGGFGQQQASPLSVCTRSFSYLGAVRRSANRDGDTHRRPCIGISARHSPRRPSVACARRRFARRPRDPHVRERQHRVRARCAAADPPSTTPPWTTRHRVGDGCDIATSDARV